MEFLNKFSAFYAGNPAAQLFLGPTVLTLIAYFIFRKRNELSLLALKNTAATIIIVGMNIGAAVFFAKDIAAALQRGFEALHIPTLPANIWDNTPLWVVCIIGIVARDFADYWNHRIMHMEWLWPCHAAHHSDTHVNAFTHFRVHFLEALVMSASYIVLLSWLQMPAAIPIVFLFAHLHNLYVHMDLPFRHGPFRLLIASPVFHRWHHADVEEAYGKNLAAVIPAWDYLFGTYYSDEKCDAPMGALKTGHPDTNPFLIYLYPFQEWARLIKSRIIAPSRARLDSRASEDGVPPSQRHPAE